MRYATVLLALLLVACSGPEQPNVSAPAAPILVTDGRTGLVAVSAVGARNVRVLLVHGPSIVRLREVFVPDGQTVAAVRFEHAALIVETDATRFALDPSTGRLARVAGDVPGVATRTRSARRG